MRNVELALVAALLAACGKDQQVTAKSTADRGAARPSVVARSSVGLPPPAPGERYAVLVGISRYPDPSDDLPGPLTDVRNIRELLVAQYGVPAANVDTITNERATRDNIIAAVRQRLSRAGPNGLALLYYSGHGMTLDRNYSVQDTEPSGLDQALKVWGAGGKASIILDDELGVMLRALPAGRVVVVLDACYSGSGTKFFPAAAANERGRPRFVNKSVLYATGDPGVAIPAGFLSDGATVSEASRDGMYALLAASADTGRAFGAKDWPQAGQSNGVFTYFLMQSLRTSDGTQTPRQIQQQVGRATRRASPCADDTACQDPQVLGTQADAPFASLLGRRP